MDLSQIGNSKYFWLVAATTILLFVVGGGPIFIDKVSNHVIQKLKKDYTPGPYDPGFNPDLIDPSSLK